MNEVMIIYALPLMKCSLLRILLNAFHHRIDMNFATWKLMQEPRWLPVLHCLTEIY